MSHKEGKTASTNQNNSPQKRTKRLPLQLSRLVGIFGRPNFVMPGVRSLFIEK